MYWNLFILLLIVTVQSTLMKDLISTVQKHSSVYQSVAKDSLTSITPITTQVKMRDGVTLWTKYWAIEENVKKDTVIIRSPYGPDGTENLAYLYLPFGYNIVMQNQRGTGESGGNWTFWKTSFYDGYDTFEWIVSQSWSNGNVYQLGASADGILSYLDMQIPQPYLKSQWVIFSNSLMYYTVFQDGSAFRKELVHHWLGKMQAYRPNAPNYEDIVLQHEGFSPWWDLTMLTNLSNVHFPALHLAGWYDIFLQPMLDTFHNYDTKSSPGALGKQQLIVGPRGHCFGLKNSDDYWFDYDLFDFLWGYESSLQLFGASADFSLSLSSSLEKYTLYVMSRKGFDSPGMYWTTIPEWPKSVPKLLYLSNTHTLEQHEQIANYTYEYIYDPKNPVPTVGGNNLFLGCGPEEQSAIETRKDVVLFTSETLSEDINVLGEITVKLFVKSNCTDTDFSIKITDVYPDGNSYLVGDNLLRMKWRLSDSKMSLMEPGEIYEVEIKLWSTCYIFSKGNKIRLAVSSSNYPRFSTNPNNGKLISEGGPEFIANNALLVGELTPSLISLPTVTKNQIPNNIL